MCNTKKANYINKNVPWNKRTLQGSLKTVTISAWFPASTRSRLFEGTGRQGSDLWTASVDPSPPVQNDSREPDCNHLCRSCGGAVRSIVPSLIQLHEIGFKLDFKILFSQCDK